MHSGFFGKPEEKISLRKTTHRLDYNIKIGDKVIGCSDTGRTFLAQGREGSMAVSCEDRNETSGSVKYRGLLD
jgi:hypothetical protein